MAKKRWRLEIFPAKFGFFPYVFLLYLLLPAYYLAYESGWKLAAGIAMLLAFTLSYRQLYFSMDKKSFGFWLALQLSIIFVLSTYYSLFNVMMGFFSANFIGWIDKGKFRIAYTFFVITLLLPLIIRWELFLGDFYYLSLFLAVMLFSPFGVSTMNSRMELERKLDEANEQIRELSKREERMRIARDLHDTLGHTLSMITLKSQLVQKWTSKDGEKAKREAKEIERISRSALKQVRELVSDLRTMTVAEELAEAKSILEAGGISLECKGNARLEGIPALTQNILSMCLREAVTNVIRHSGAKHCWIDIEKGQGDVSITVKDDGKGMKTEVHDGNGIKGMRERLGLIDGGFSVESDEGTAVLITVPIIIREKKVGEVS